MISRWGMVSLGDKLRAAREAKRLSQAHVAAKLGITRVAVGNWENGISRPSLDNLLKVCQLLGIPIGEVTEVSTPDASMDYANQELEDANIQRRPHNLVPIYATVFGEEPGEFLLTDEVVEYVRPPSALRTGGRVGAMYGGFVSTHALSPRYEIGEVFLIWPARPPRAMDYVLVKLKEKVDGLSRCLLRRLVRREPGEVTLESLSPPKCHSIPISQIEALHRVIGWEELIER